MAENILTILLSLWAEQNGVEIKDLVITKNKEVETC